MTSPFVWFDNIGPARGKTTDFLAQTFGWTTQDIGPMTFLTNGGEMPFAATCDAMEGVSGWVPYIEVQDLSAETQKARDNGADILAEALEGPAGTATFLRDPGGAVLAIWKRNAA
ncbi:Glyoxalase-like domain protein [Pelagimonas phthalicica]|uniref:Glyoxalase-like domain protein n=1 Tax=Pelagimonas phthalicica TaxID=1037362 RepID=A0A238JH05_9RHOB|nr:MULTISPECIES: hypothetical protein [Roseobacteraceae]MBO9467135.1 hypothetical protein [Tropicibacter sp. R15_0]TDS92356.1 putative enzyme related to lactoylglutathione lyase [Pelagimonas phthalicica]SMX29417.1 Glyoxalase-like domain protein [Pelagimonas phthalicica]